jgi:hypothetical protein
MQRFEGGSLGVVVAVVVSILLLRVFRVHMPPALAVGALSFVMAELDRWYPISVGIGTIALTLWFLGHGYLQKSLKNSRTKSLTREVMESTSGLMTSKDGHSTVVVDVSKFRHSLNGIADFQSKGWMEFPRHRCGRNFYLPVSVRQNGTYWYHSHSQFQEQTGLLGTIVIEPRD